MSAPIPSWLVLTDISGYTGFVQSNTDTLHHAHYVIGELMTAILEAAGALVPAKLEGDAIFFSGAESALDGAKVGEALTRMFDAFTARRDQMVAANLCPCAACSEIGNLELKAFVHRGPVVRYNLGQFQELAGLDIIVLHRLLKNSVDGRRYILATEAAWPALSLALPARAHRETYPDIGDIACWVAGDEATRPHSRSRAGWRERQWESAKKHVLGALFRFKLRHPAGSVRQAHVRPHSH